MRTRVMRRGVLVAGALVIVASGCNPGEPTAREGEIPPRASAPVAVPAADITRVEIVRGLDRKAMQSYATTTITDQKTIADLLTFFPELGQKSEDAAGWMAGYTLTFLRKRGEPITVHVHWDLQFWSEGTGDWRLQDPEKFQKLMDELLKKKRPRASA